MLLQNLEYSLNHCNQPFWNLIELLKHIIRSQNHFALSLITVQKIEEVKRHPNAEEIQR